MQRTSWSSPSWAILSTLVGALGCVANHEPVEPSSIEKRSQALETAPLPVDGRLQFGAEAAEGRLELSPFDPAVAMAETVHLHLKSHGEDLQGEAAGLHRENSIECLSFVDAVRTGREKGSGMASGRRTWEPIVFTTRVDGSSRRLARALRGQEEIEGVLEFFRPSPTGDGTTERFFSVELLEGQVASIRFVSPDTIDPASAGEPPTEELTMVFHSIDWNYEPTGASHHDSWRENQ